MTKTKYRWTEEEQVQVKSVKVVRKLRVFGGKDLWKRYALRPVTARVHTICELFSSAVCTTYSCGVSTESTDRISTTQRSCRPSEVAVVEHHEGHWTVGHQHSLVRVRLQIAFIHTLTRAYPTFFIGGQNQNRSSQNRKAEERGLGPWQGPATPSPPQERT